MKIIAGNWKMNGTHENLVKMIQDLSAIDTKNAIILCVPYTMLCTDSGKIALATQDISAHDHGAYTGEISAKMDVWHDKECDKMAQMAELSEHRK